MQTLYLYYINTNRMSKRHITDNNTNTTKKLKETELYEKLVEYAEKIHKRELTYNI